MDACFGTNERIVWSELFSLQGRKLVMTSPVDMHLKDDDLQGLAQFLTSRGGLAHWRAELKLAAQQPLMIRQLDLSSNLLGDEGIVNLADALLEHQVHLQVLRLHRNRIADVGASGVAGLIAGAHGQLEEVHLSHNFLSPQAVRCLVEAAGHRPEYPPGTAPPLWLRLEMQQSVNMWSEFRGSVDKCCGRAVRMLEELSDNIAIARRKLGLLPPGPRGPMLCMVSRREDNCKPRCCSVAHDYGPIVHLPYFWRQGRLSQSSRDNGSGQKKLLTAEERYYKNLNGKFLEPQGCHTEAEVELLAEESQLRSEESPYHGYSIDERVHLIEEFTGEHIDERALHRIRLLHDCSPETAEGAIRSLEVIIRKQGGSVKNLSSMLQSACKRAEKNCERQLIFTAAQVRREEEYSSTWAQDETLMDPWPGGVSRGGPNVEAAEEGTETSLGQTAQARYGRWQRRHRLLPQLKLEQAEASRFQSHAQKTTVQGVQSCGFTGGPAVHTHSLLNPNAPVFAPGRREFNPQAPVFVPSSLVKLPPESPRSEGAASDTSSEVLLLQSASR